MTDAERVKLGRIEFENKLAVFPDECKEWLCSLVRRLDAERAVLENRVELLEGVLDEQRL